MNRQPHFKSQPKEQIVVWVYGLFVEKLGDYAHSFLLTLCICLLAHSVESLQTHLAIGH